MNQKHKPLIPQLFQLGSWKFLNMQETPRIVLSHAYKVSFFMFAFSHSRQYVKWIISASEEGSLDDGFRSVIFDYDVFALFLQQFSDLQNQCEHASEKQTYASKENMYYCSA